MVTYYHKYKHVKFTDDVVNPGDGPDSVEVIREFEFTEVTPGQLATELSDSLGDLYRGLSFAEQIGDWLSTSKTSTGRPRISLMVKVKGVRRATKEEKLRFAPDEATIEERRVREDEDTLQKIYDRSPHLFSTYR